MSEAFDPKAYPAWSQPCQKCSIRMENHRDAYGAMTPDCWKVIIRTPR